MSEILEAFLQNEAAIRRYLARYRANAQDLEDFVQETFLRGFAAEMKSAIKEPKAYLFQIAKSIALEALRKNQRARTSALEDCGGTELLLDEDQAGAAAWLEGRRKLALFVRAVAELPPQCRTAFLLRRVEGLQYKQIANRMRISVSAVEKHVTAGLLKCSAYLREHGYDPRELAAPLSKHDRGSLEGEGIAPGKEAAGEDE
jgi:RNA polymerase sigma-70 factor (ECF subfamily)